MKQPGKLSKEDQKLLELHGRSVDWFLQTLASIANASEGFEFGITLHVPGGLVSGTLIGGKAYFYEFARLFAGGHDDLRSAIESNGDAYVGPDQDQPNYIHLRNARTFTP